PVIRMAVGKISGQAFDLFPGEQQKKLREEALLAAHKSFRDEPSGKNAVADYEAAIRKVLAEIDPVLWGDGLQAILRDRAAEPAKEEVVHAGVPESADSDPA